MPAMPCAMAGDAASRLAASRQKTVLTVLAPCQADRGGGAAASANAPGLFTVLAGCARPVRAEIPLFPARARPLLTETGMDRSPWVWRIGHDSLRGVGKSGDFGSCPRCEMMSPQAWRAPVEAVTVRR